MAKLVYSYHNKKMSVTNFKSLWRRMSDYKYVFFVDIDGHPAVIEYYSRFATYIDASLATQGYEKVNDFSFAKKLLDDHNRYIRETMQNANKNIEVRCDTPDHECEFLPMADILDRAFITYKGQQLF